jgi:apolipoprotein N-acyltransferase
MKDGVWRHLAESMALGCLLALAFIHPAPSGWGFHEALLAFLFPALLLRAVLQGRHLGWIYLTLLVGFSALFHWVPAMIADMGNLPYGVAVLATILLNAYEALGFLGVAWVARVLHRRSGPWAAALGAALGVYLWECCGFHVYTWSWGAALGGLPWLARSAAFLTSYGCSALFWGGAVLAGDRLSRRAWGPAARVPATLLGILLLLAGAWSLLPRSPERELDVVIIQPNFDPGTRMPGMEAEMWARSDAELKDRGLPRKEVATLLLWAESSVMEPRRDERRVDPRLPEEARRRGLAWLYGTEGGAFNLLRGEAPGRPTFLQAKVQPMPFGERMPGPAPVRRALDRLLDWHSQEPGELGPRSSFGFDTPQGPLRVHPLICSEAMDGSRVQRGLATAGGELLSNHSNDGWFERSIATDLHGAQIRLRAVETGLPLVRATLTGKSGLFREDGSWALWGEARSEAAYAFTLRWRPIQTPARHAVLGSLWLSLLGIGTMLLAWRRRAQP